MAARTRPPIRWDDLPLFVARDTDLAEAIVGPDAERKQVWLAGLPRLEACGFPKTTPGHGRYRPAVKSFYDKHYGMVARERPEPQEAVTWTPRRRSPARPTERS